MKRFYEKSLIESCLKQIEYESAMSSLQNHLFMAQYEKEIGRAHV